ncbi:MAG: hypothetical protein RL385_6175, partial [Pseudomonadota bacterium]
MRALPDSGTMVRAGLLLLWLGLASGLAWAVLWYPYEVKDGADGRDVPVELASGANLEDLAALLAREGVAKRPRATAFYLRLLGLDASMRTGNLVLQRKLSLRDHLPRISRAYGSVEIQVPIPEGFTRFDVALRLGRYGIAAPSDVLATSVDPAWLTSMDIAAESAEGYLFPAAYRLRLDSGAQTALTRMVRTFRERTTTRFDSYAASHATDPDALSPYQLLILASMVEREAQVDDERAIIAGVFVNRLRDPNFKPKRLQSDPTVAYGCRVMPERAPSCAEFDGRRITPAMVRDPENPYSTYRREGLPPGPIANPGLPSIDAAIAPAAHDYFYFVAKGGGRHAFSHALSEHNA